MWIRRSAIRGAVAAATQDPDRYGVGERSEVQIIRRSLAPRSIVVEGARRWRSCAAGTYVLPEDVMILVPDVFRHLGSVLT
jgi:hypothetical protein